MLDTFRMVVVAFSVMDKANRVIFFEETFLVANVSPKVVFGMLHLILSNANIDFFGQELWWKTCNIEITLLTTRHVKLVDKTKFPAAALDLVHEIYKVHVRSVSSVALLSFLPFKLNIHLFCRTQISDLITKKAPTKVPDKYIDFADEFFSDLVSELPKHTRINDHAIKLVDSE